MRRKDKEEIKSERGEKGRGRKTQCHIGCIQPVGYAIFPSCIVVCFTQPAASCLVVRHDHRYRGSRSCLIRFGFQLDKF